MFCKIIVIFAAVSNLVWSYSDSLWWQNHHITALATTPNSAWIHNCNVGQGILKVGEYGTTIYEKAFIMRFVSWRCEIWQFQNPVTEHGNDRCSWVICSVPISHQLSRICFCCVCVGWCLHGINIQSSAWVSVRCSFLTGWAHARASECGASDR